MGEDNDNCEITYKTDRSSPEKNDIKRIYISAKTKEDALEQFKAVCEERLEDDG